MKLKFKSLKNVLLSSAIALTSVSSIGASVSAQAATTSLTVSSSKLTSSVVIDNVTVPSGYYKIDICAKNNQGFDGLGMELAFTNFSPVTKSGEIVYESSKMGTWATAVSSSGTYALAGLSSKLVSTDCTIISVYAKKNSGTSSVKLTVKSLTNSDTGKEYISSSTTTTSKIDTAHACIIGDANGDSSVNSSDSVLISQHSGYTTKQVNSNLSTWFPCVKIVRQLDVNDDGYVNSTDSNQVLEYYANALVSKAYSTNPEIGKTYYFSN
jgi:hypothetical protein